MSEERFETFRDEFFGMVAQSVEEGWDAETTETELTELSQNHGIYFPGLQYAVGLSLDGDAVGISAYQDLNGDGLTISGYLDFVDEQSGAAMELAERSRIVDAYDRGFLSLNIGGENTIRVGAEYGVTVDGGLGTLNGNLSVATDGTMIASMKGELGRRLFGVGAEVSLPMYDMDYVIEQQAELFDPAMEAIDAAGEDGQAWARDVVAGILEDEGGGGLIPQSRIFMAAAAANYEYTGETTYEFGRGELGAMGESYHSGWIRPVGEDHYRIRGAVNLGTDPVRGPRIEQYDVITDAEGRVYDGVSFESFNDMPGYSAPTSFSIHRFSHQGLGEESVLRNVNPNMRDTDVIAMRQAELAGHTERLDALEASLTPRSLPELVDIMQTSAITLNGEITASREAGTLTPEQAVTGRLIADDTPYYPATRLDPDTELVLPAHDPSDPLESFCAAADALVTAGEEAGIDMSEGGYREDLDYTGLSEPEFDAMHAQYLADQGALPEACQTSEATPTAEDASGGRGADAATTEHARPDPAEDDIYHDVF